MFGHLTVSFNFTANRVSFKKLYLIICHLIYKSKSSLSLSLEFNKFWWKYIFFFSREELMRNIKSWEYLFCYLPWIMFFFTNVGTFLVYYSLDNCIEQISFNTHRKVTRRSFFRLLAISKNNVFVLIHQFQTWFGIGYSMRNIDFEYVAISLIRNHLTQHAFIVMLEIIGFKTFNLMNRITYIDRWN